MITLKKIANLGLFCLIICILSTGIVFATDHTVSGTNFQSIQDKIDSANSGDRILLGSGTYTGSGSRMGVSGNKSLTIQGSSNANRATLNANNLHGILAIQSGSSATIRYVNFVNGGLSYSGSSPSVSENHALVAHGTVLIENCNFLGSRGDSGSAIYVNATASNTIIRNCNFTNNHADNHGANNYTSGGAICIDGADNTEVRNCYFSGNTALNYGGALTIRNTALNAKVINCDFVNNKAPNGGAIYNQLGTTTISGCTFTNNQATDSGGAIYSLVGLTISSSSFNKNTAKNNGGAIFLSGSARSIISGNSKFTSNSAKNGGAIYTSSPLNVSSSKFSTNKASSNGGAIYSKNDLTVSKSTLSKNSASYGSGVYSSNTLRIASNTLSGNSAKFIKIEIISAPSSVKSGAKATVKAGLVFGDNVANAYYSTNGNVYVNNKKTSVSKYAPNKKITLKFNGKSQSKNSDSKGVATFSVTSKVFKITTYKATANPTHETKKVFASKNIKFVMTSKSTVKPTIISSAKSSRYSKSGKIIKGIKRPATKRPPKTIKIGSKNIKVKISKNKKNYKVTKISSNNKKIVETYSNVKTHKVKVYSIVRNKKGKLVKNSKLVSKEKIIEAYVLEKVNIPKNTKLKTDYYKYKDKDKKFEHITTLNGVEKLDNIVGVTGKWIKVTPDNYLMYRWFKQRKYTSTYKKGDLVTKTYINGKLISTTKKKKGVAFTVKSKITNKKNSNALTSEQFLLNENLSSTLDCNISNKEIKKQVKSIFNTLSDREKKSDIAVANAIWRWNRDEVPYDYSPVYGGTRRGSDEMIKDKIGNCVDHAHLAVAMFRIAGLPAKYYDKAIQPIVKLKNGTMVKKGDASGHAWAMVYVNKKWLNADTVINDGKMRGQSLWINPKKHNYTTLRKDKRVNYNFQKNKKLSNVWHYIAQSIIYLDGTVKARYIL